MPGIKDLQGKVVVITGAASGIGKATALAFSKLGSRLVLADINAQKLDEVAHGIAVSGGSVLVKQTDVSDQEQVRDLSAFTIRERGAVDVLHNNAGVSVGARIEDTSIGDWEWLLRINLWGVIYGVHFFLPYMIRQRSGHIVNTSSVLGLCATPGTGTYATAKFGITGLGETLRSEVRRYNIGVSTICPGLIDTRIVEDGRIHLHQDARVTNDNLATFFKKGWPPEKVARAVIRAVRHNKAVVPVGPEAWINWYVKRVSQTVYNAFLVLSDRYLM